MRWLNSTRSGLSSRSSLHPSPSNLFHSLQLQRYSSPSLEPQSTSSSAFPSTGVLLPSFRPPIRPGGPQLRKGPMSSPASFSPISPRSSLPLARPSAGNQPTSRQTPSAFKLSVPSTSASGLSPLRAPAAIRELVERVSRGSGGGTRLERARPASNVSARPRPKLNGRPTGRPTSQLTTSTDLYTDLCDKTLLPDSPPIPPATAPSPSSPPTSLESTSPPVSDRITTAHEQPAELNVASPPQPSPRAPPSPPAWLLSPTPELVPSHTLAINLAPEWIPDLTDISARSDIRSRTSSPPPPPALAEPDPSAFSRPADASPPHPPPQVSPESESTPDAMPSVIAERWAAKRKEMAQRDRERIERQRIAREKAARRVAASEVPIASQPGHASTSSSSLPPLPLFLGPDAEQALPYAPGTATRSLQTSAARGRSPNAVARRVPPPVFAREASVSLVFAPPPPMSAPPQRLSPFRASAKKTKSASSLARISIPPLFLQSPTSPLSRSLRPPRRAPAPPMSMSPPFVFFSGPTGSPSAPPRTSNRPSLSLKVGPRRTMRAVLETETLAARWVEKRRQKMLREQRRMVRRAEKEHDVGRNRVEHAASRGQPVHLPPSPPPSPPPPLQRPLARRFSSAPSVRPAFLERMTEPVGPAVSLRPSRSHWLQIHRLPSALNQHQLISTLRRIPHLSALDLRECIKFAGSSTAFVLAPTHRAGDEEISQWLEREKQDAFLWGGQDGTTIVVDELECAPPASLMALAFGNGTIST